MTERVLVTGATGFIGARLAARLATSAREVRCLVRDRGGRRARELERDGFDLHEGDVLRPETLRGAGQGVDVAYYLIHSMGRGGPKDFAASERAAATAFARMARAEGIERIIYLGGLGDRPQSHHLRSRHETALALREHGPALSYFRAGMVVGPQSESYRTLRYLVQRLPAMIAPAWLKNATQPIAIDDTLSYLIEALTVEESVGEEIQIGGPDVLSYGEMLDRMAEVLDIGRRPRIPVPLITPWLSSLWIGLVTPVDAGVARPLIEGLAVPTVVTDPPECRCSTLSQSASTEHSDAPSQKTPSLRPHELPSNTSSARVPPNGIVLLWLILRGLGGSPAQRFQDVRGRALPRAAASDRSTRCAGRCGGPTRGVRGTRSPRPCRAPRIPRPASPTRRTSAAGCSPSKASGWSPKLSPPVTTRQPTSSCAILDPVREPGPAPSRGATRGQPDRACARPDRRTERLRHRGWRVGLRVRCSLNRRPRSARCYVTLAKGPLRCVDRRCGPRSAHDFAGGSRDGTFFVFRPRRLGRGCWPGGRRFRSSWCRGWRRG
jgi:uncharacterized protein YbjT (DUF2867 family)